MAVDPSCSEDQRKEQNTNIRELLAIVDTARTQITNREFLGLQKYNF